MPCIFKRLFFVTGAIFLVMFLFACNADRKKQEPIPVSADGGWKSLFDGETLKGWSGANGAEIGSQWQVVNGDLVLTAGGGGDIITVDKYKNFELSLEWKISKAGNSGIFYRVVSDGDPVWMSGVEYQVLDNRNYPGLSNDSHKAGGVFDMYIPLVDSSQPVGEFNKARIIVNNGHVEHWLNDRKVVEYQWLSDDWKQRLAKSKFRDWKNFGRFEVGHIALQDHGNVVSYRNIKIKKL